MMLVTDRADKREIAVLTSANTTCRPEAQHEVLLGSEAINWISKTVI